MKSLLHATATAPKTSGPVHKVNQPTNHLFYNWGKKAHSEYNARLRCSGGSGHCNAVTNTRGMTKEINQAHPSVFGSRSVPRPDEAERPSKGDQPRCKSC